MANTKRIQLRRGTTAEHATFTGAQGELTIDTTRNIGIVHDGLIPGGHELVGVAATGQSIVNKISVGIGTSFASSELTVVGDSVVSGNVSIGGSLTVGNNTLIIDGDSNKINGPYGVLDFTYGGSSRINNLNIVGVGLTTTSSNYTVAKTILEGSKFVGLTTTVGIATGDYLTIPGVIEDSEITDIVSISTSTYYNRKLLTQVSKAVSTGSTIIGIATNQNVVVGDYLTVPNVYTNVPINGLTTVELSPINQVINTTTVLQTVSAGSTVIGVANTLGVSIGSSISIVGSGLVADYSNDPLNPTTVTYTESDLNIQNIVGAGDTDYVTFTVGGSNIQYLYLTKYVGQDNKAFFAIQQGSTYTAGINTNQMLTYGHFGPGTSSQGVGSNLLNGVVLNANTTYTMWINQTNVSDQTEYVISTNSGYTGISQEIFDNVPVVGFSTISVTPTNILLSSTFISTHVSVGSSIIGIANTSGVSIGNSITINGYIQNAPIVGITTFALPTLETAVNTTNISSTVSVGSTVIGIANTGNISIGSSFIISGISTIPRSIVAITTDSVLIGAANTFGVSIGSGTTITFYDRISSVTGAVIISAGSTSSSVIDTFTNVDISYVSDVAPAILIGAGYTYSDIINAGTAATFTNPVQVFGPAVTIGAGFTFNSDVSVGSAVSITSLTDKLAIVTISDELSSTVPALTDVTINKIDPPDSNLVVNNFKAVGITTLEKLILNGLNFPTTDGLKGQVLVTDGQGNIGFGTGGGSGGADVILKVSANTGDDANDGKILPLRTIKKATQLASKIGKPVTILVETGEYVEDNPIIVYDDVSIIGDSLRNIFVRPLNAGKDLFKVRNGCYLTGMTFNDYVDPTTGVPQHTYNYSVSFDDPFNSTVSRTGYASQNVLTIASADYNNVTGITTITTTQPHELYRGNTVRLQGLDFVCGYDEVGISTFVYDNVSGISTITFFALPESYKVGDRLYLNNLPFTCSAEHAGVTTTIFPYPGLDPVYGAVYPITGINTAAKTVTITGAASTIPHVYQGYPTIGISTFVYDNVSGIATATTTTPHGYSSGDKIALNGLEFSCSSGAGTTTIFPDGTITDYTYDGYTFTVGEVLSPTSFVYNVGVSTIAHTYVTGGTVRKVPTTQEVWTYPDRNSNGAVDFGVVRKIDDYTFMVRCGISTIPHRYIQGGTARFSLPLINKSPYIQNCSILSSLGGNGILVDGDKVTKPNVGLIPELGEIPVVGDQPEFGASMVAATFTMISFGGIGWRTINDGYAQVVSCFQIFCRYGSLTQSGGYLSITNSATNFGDFALRSTGYSRKSFAFDRGRVVSTGTQDGLQTLGVIGLGRADQELYVLKFYDNDNIDRTSNFKPLVVNQEFTAANISTVTSTFNIPGHPFQNEDSIVYFGDESTDPPNVIDNFVSGNLYYVQYIDAANFKLYLDEGLETLVTIGSTFVGINTFTKNNQEFFVNEIIDSHTSYQNVSLGTTSNTLNFIPGQQVTQTLLSGNTAVGYALTYNSSNRQLVVSVESVGGTRRFFSNTGGAIQDHSVSPVSVGVTDTQLRSDYTTTEFKVGSTVPGNVIAGVNNLPVNYQCHLHRPSIINSSAHTWEYSGSGTDYNALPQNGGKANPATEQVSELGGRVYSSGTNELGDFKIGSQITAFNRTGNIIFNNKVTIGELESIRLSLSGGVAIEEFSTDVNLGENEVGGPLNKRVSTQLAVRSFFGNRLGTFIDKTVSTNAIPNAVVQLNSNGQINPDLIPPKVVNYVSTPIVNGRFYLVNQIPAIDIKQGDTVVQPDNAYILVNDTVGQYLVLDPGNYNFTHGAEVRSALASAVTGIITAPPTGIGIGTTIQSYVGYGTTGHVSGVALNVNITSAGSGYSNPGIYTGVYLDSITGIGTSAIANITVGAGGSVTAINIFAGGRYYNTGDIVSINDPSKLGGRVGGSNFTATVSSVENRLYLSLTGNQKFAGSSALVDFIEDNNAIGISTTLEQSYAINFSPTDILIGGDVNFDVDRIVVGINSFSDGDPVIYSANGNNVLTAAGTGIIDGNTYYIKLVGAGTSVELHRTYALNSKIDFTGSGNGTHSLIRNVVNDEKDTLFFEGHPFTVGTPVRASDSTPVGITTGEFYYCGSITTNTFTLHTTQTDALASVNGTSFNVIGISTGSTGTFTLKQQNVRYAKTVNTSSTDVNNWSLVATATIDAGNIASGIISPSRLGTGEANSDTFLLGTSEYVKAVKSVGIGSTEPITMTGSSVDFSVGINTYYGNLDLKLNRVQSTLDQFSTLGVSKFKTSTFSIGADGAVEIKSSATGDVDAATLGGQGGAYYLNSANHTGAVPITRGGTGLTGAPASGAILIGNGSAYNLTTDPTFTGNVTIPKVFVNRAGNTASGISWYSDTYTSWATYMAQAGQTSTGPTGNITAPSGTLVNSWALRNFVENSAGYGWTFESGSSTGQPSVVAEIRSSDGSIRSAGNIVAAGSVTATTGLVLGTTTFPAPTTADIGGTLRYDDRGMYWDTQQGDVYTGATVVRGYTMAGYQNSSAWRNVNRTDHASQTTYNLGDQITTADAYVAAGSNGTFAYMFNSGGGYNSNAREINRFNMLTDSNSDIATQMLTNKNFISVMRHKFLYSYVMGNERPEKFIHATETPQLTFNSGGDINGSHANNPACGQGELRGWHNASSSRGNYLEFATETWTSWGAPSSDGTNKAISSYNGYMYWNTGGGYQTTAAMSKRDDYTGSQILTIGKPGSTGEESFHTGELAGYMIGMYNGSQNNQGGLMNYTNNTFTFVNSLNSQGVGGRASAAGIDYGRGV